MEIRPGYVYFLSEEYFNIVKDPTLMRNKGFSHSRPFYCCKREKDTNLYWMIPLSSQSKKFREQFARSVSKYGSCLTVALGRFGGRDAAFLIQNACLTTPEYITDVYTINNNPVPVHSTLQKVIYSKLQRSLAIKSRGYEIFYTDIEKNIKALEDSTQRTKPSLIEMVTFAEKRRMIHEQSQTASHDLQAVKQI